MVSKKFSKDFANILKNLEDIGYNNYYKVLNAKDFGIPQNRERIFIISIRKDIDDGSFEFPTPVPLNMCLRDLLDQEVDDKYYLSEKLINYFLANSKLQKAKGNGFEFKPTDGGVLRKALQQKQVTGWMTTL